MGSSLTNWNNHGSLLSWRGGHPQLARSLPVPFGIVYLWFRFKWCQELEISPYTFLMISALLLVIHRCAEPAELDKVIYQSGFAWVGVQCPISFFSVWYFFQNYILQQYLISFSVSFGKGHLLSLFRLSHKIIFKMRTILWQLPSSIFISVRTFQRKIMTRDKLLLRRCLKLKDSS